MSIIHTEKDNLMKGLNNLYAIPQLEIEFIPKKLAIEKISELNDLIENYFKSIDYNENDKNTIERPLLIPLDKNILSEKEKLSIDNKNVLLQEGVQECSNKINLFLKKYHFGYCRKIHLQKNGFLDIEIGCLITTPFMSDKEVSAKLYFNKQIDRLKEKGIIFEENKTKIIANEQNFATLNMLLQEINARGIKFECRKENKKDNPIITIERVNFCVSPKHLLEFEFLDLEDKIEENKDFLTKDDLSKITRSCKEIAGAVGTIEDMNSLKKICCETIVGYYYDLCKYFDIEKTTPISKRYLETFSKTKEENGRLFELEETLGKKITGEDIETGVKELYSKFNVWAIENLGFSCEEFEFGQYNFSKFELRMITNNNTRFFYEDEGLPENKKLKFIKETHMNEIFKCVGNMEMENFYIIDNDNNRMKIIDIIQKKYPTMIVEKFDSEYLYDAGLIGIKRIVLNIKNILELI